VNTPPIQSFPGVVVICGPALRAGADCALIAARARRQNGLPDSTYFAELARAFLQASACGHPDVPEPPALQSLTSPTVTIQEAATRMNISPRQARRLARRLGGQKAGRIWLLDDQAITEHLEGQHRG